MNLVAFPIDQARKAFPGTNALAYLAPASLTKKKVL
jgi:hypothetical protein